MPDTLDKLVADLNRRDVVDWLPGMNAGRPAYDRIRLEVVRGELTSNQLRNALHVLFRLRVHGDQREIFSLFVRTTAHSEKKVRTEALKLAIGFLRLPQPRVAAASEDFAAFRAAIASGVAPEVEALTRDFLSDAQTA